MDRCGKGSWGSGIVSATLTPSSIAIISFFLAEEQYCLLILPLYIKSNVLKENTVTHPGFIKTIEAQKIEVTIISVSGCASCQIKGSCSVSDTEEKSVWVNLDNPSDYQIGQQVTVQMSQSMGTWAVLFGYVFPFVVLVAGLIGFLSLGLDQGLSGLLALGMLVPYYLVLYFTRHWLGTRFKYTLSALRCSGFQDNFINSF